MVENRIDQSFQRLYEKYGYSKNNSSNNKNIFEQLDDCDKQSKKTTKSLNESLITEGTHDNKFFYVQDNNKTYLVSARDEQGAKDEAVKSLKIQNPEIKEAQFEVDPTTPHGWQRAQDYCKANNIEIVRADDDGTYYNRMNNNQAIKESLYGGQPLTKEQLVKKMGGTPDKVNDYEATTTYESLINEAANLERSDFIILTGEPGSGNVAKARQALEQAGVKFRMATYQDIVNTNYRVNPQENNIASDLNLNAHYN